ncbi:MAG TPA: oligosaccharide flippase family protein [Steroidobacteraceae bacterium]|jgi:O-antigen/teichoic acid export membrane protein|nr:oligosaccharide flippase family protein [Steroidobacteraceae bacterium]
MTPTSAPGSPPVLRNAIWLIGAQVLGAPVSVLVNAVAGRYLGPADFGVLYLASTYAGFALLFVEWGGYGVITGKIATHRSRAGELLGSAMVWRIMAAMVAGAVVLGLCGLVGYGRSFLFVMSLMLVSTFMGSLATSVQDAVRGFERTDFAALSYLGGQLLMAAVVISALRVGLGLRGLLLGQILCATIGVIFVLWMLPRLNIPRLSLRWHTVRELFRDGRSFLVFVVILQLQPLVDGAMMSRFATPDAIGWFAVSRKLLGVLVFPAAAVGNALYPTLVRQYNGDLAGCRATVRGALRALCLVVFPLTIGSILFPQIGVMIFSVQKFAPAEQNLRVLALWLFLLYFSIPLSQCITASGRQVPWAAVQFCCVIVSAVADPPLISWFQAHWGNGGLGVCIASVFSEVLMVTGAVFLVPKGVLDASLLRLLGKPALAGAVMAGVGLLVGRYNTVVGAIVAVASYAGVLWLVGELRGANLRSLIGSFRPRATAEGGT